MMPQFHSLMFKKLFNRPRKVTMHCSSCTGY